MCVLLGWLGTLWKDDYQLLLAFVRKDKKVALLVASSGIAALLLEGGKTAHARFKIPLNSDGESMSRCTSSLMHTLPVSRGFVKLLQLQSANQAC